MHPTTKPTLTHQNQMLYHSTTKLPARFATTVSRQLTSASISFSDYLLKCKLTAMRSLQYCCLLIPIKNRELLQMLLKFMVKLMENHVISLSDELPTKEMVRQWLIAKTERSTVIQNLCLVLNTRSPWMFQRVIIDWLICCCNSSLCTACPVLQQSNIWCFC